MGRWWMLTKRMVRMGFFGALGATVGALAGEALFVAGDAPPKETPKAICLLFDVSGSMRDMVGDETQLHVLKRTADEFLLRQNWERDTVGLVTFSSISRRLASSTREPGPLHEALEDLNAHGATNMGAGLEAAHELLAEASGEPWVLLFTDGKPQSYRDGRDRDSAERKALEAAAALRASGQNIVAIGTGLADTELLAQITGDEKFVITSDFASLADAFLQSEELIHNHELLASSAQPVDLRATLLRAIAWAALIATGAGLLLVVAQNRFLHRRSLSVGESLRVGGGAILTGALAGTAGQGLFYALAQEEALILGARLAAWVVLGCGAVLGMSYFVPNLPRRRAAWAGAVGGVLAALAFLRLAPMVGDPPGRLLAAATLGLCTGLVLVWVEAVSRKAWLSVHWGNGEQSTLSLGAKPIVIGQSAKAHICPSWDVALPAVMAKIRIQDGEIRFQAPRTKRDRVLAHGDQLNYGEVEIRVHQAAAEKEAKAAPRKKAAAEAKGAERSEPKAARTARKSRRSERRKERR